MRNFQIYDTNVSTVVKDSFMGEETVLHYHSNMALNTYSFWLREVAMTLREKCPNTELFLVRIFLYLDWIWRFTSVQIRSYFWSVFFCIYEVNLCIQYKYRKILTRNNSVFGHFSRSVRLLKKELLTIRNFFICFISFTTS